VDPDATQVVDATEAAGSDLAGVAATTPDPDLAPVTDAAPVTGAAPGPRSQPPASGEPASDVDLGGGI
jgi:hypothetical protein